MARYLWKVSYSVDGAKGLIAEGGTARRTASRSSSGASAGSSSRFDYALGEDDAYVIAEMPNATDVAAVSLAVAASGGARVTTVELLTPAEMDKAAKRNIAYRAPGA